MHEPKSFLNAALKHLHIYVFDSGMALVKLRNGTTFSLPFGSFQFYKSFSVFLLLFPLKVLFSADTNQALRLCLGTKTTGAEFGAVSALSINHDCSRLLCGFAKGQVLRSFYPLFTKLFCYSS